MVLGLPYTFNMTSEVQNLSSGLEDYIEAIYTSQLEDKKLDLKLKRLDTERNALNTEIDAVKKVIQDATDHGFKTFSG